MYFKDLIDKALWEQDGDDDMVVLVNGLLSDFDNPQFLDELKKIVAENVEAYRESLKTADRCPDCGERELEHKETHKATYNEPAEGYNYCPRCGWSSK